MERLTRDDISRVHRVLVLDEAEAIHQLDLGDLSRAMGRKVSLDIGLGGWWVASVDVSVMKRDDSSDAPLRGRLPR